MYSGVLSCVVTLVYLCCNNMRHSTWLAYHYVNALPLPLRHSSLLLYHELSRYGWNNNVLSLSV